jgi:hypothetical protein
MATIKNHYDSIQGLRDLPLPINPHNAQIFEGTVKGSYHDKNWFGPKDETAEQVLEYCKTGWTYGTEQAEKMKEQITLPVMESLKRRIVKGPQGDYLDIHKVNRGQLDTAWTKKKRNSSRGPRRFQLVCKLGGNCNISGIQLLWRGVACLALSQALIEAGNSVEIIGFNNTKNVYQDGTNILNTVQIKSYTTPFDIMALTTVIGLSGFYRYYMFLARLQSEKDATWGLGRSCDEPPKIESGQAKQIIIPTDLHTKKSVIDYLKNVDVN